MLTAKSAKIRGDLRRRIFVTRIDPGCPREQRTDFRHIPLEQWVVQERARLLEAAFTVRRAWIAQGCQASEPRAAKHASRMRQISSKEYGKSRFCESHSRR